VIRIRKAQIKPLEVRIRDHQNKCEGGREGGRKRVKRGREREGKEGERGREKREKGFSERGGDRVRETEKETILKQT
jgi:hypothetical protein